MGNQTPVHGKMKKLDDKVMQLVCRLADMSGLPLLDCIDMVMTKIDEQLEYWETHFDDGTVKMRNTPTLPPMPADRLRELTII